MIKYNSKLFQEAVESVPPDIKKMIDIRFEVADRIHSIMQKKGLSNTDLAKMMSKKEPEVVKWLSGRQNFTIETLAKISAALDEDIITCVKD